MAGPKIYDRLLEELVPAVESLQVGDPAEGEDVEMGPVISRAQQERVLGFLDRAKGATVLTGGGTNGDRGFFVKPTVVTDVGQDGRDRPARGVRPGGDRPALRRGRPRRSRGRTTSRTGWPHRCGRATSAARCSAARKLQFGTVWINDHIPLVSEMPHGGYKQSGYGKDLSMYSLEDYTQIKHVMAKVD